MILSVRDNFLYKYGFSKVGMIVLHLFSLHQISRVYIVYNTVANSDHEKVLGKLRENSQEEFGLETVKKLRHKSHVDYIAEGWPKGVRNEPE